MFSPASTNLAVPPSRRLAFALALLTLAPRALLAAEPTPAQLAFFENKIRPVLVQKCYSCHSAEAKEKGKLKAALYVDSREGLLYGGETGPALIAGKPADSLLIKTLRHLTEDLAMPPKEKLPPAVIADFETWITQGAPDPRVGGHLAGAKHEINLDAGRNWWAFKPLQPVTVPTVKNTAAIRNAVDNFILARQEAAGLTPSAAASRQTLIRRVSFDLTGLPPTPAEVAAFVADNSPQACATLVEQLLARPTYGERWARHWLDVVRYAESGGYEFDGFRPGAYHYRDWVIRSFNADLPYDRFLQLQLAGDKLQPENYDGAAAAGFLVAGPYPGQTTAKTLEKIRYDQLDDMVSTLGSGVLGLTLGCVRCHDHKYDPLPQKDYYALAATLARTAQGNVMLDPDPEDTRQALAAHAAAQAKLVANLRKFETEEFPARLAAWQKTKLPALTQDAVAQTLALLDAPATTNAPPASDGRWQTLDIHEATANNSFLEASPDAIITHGGRTKAPPAQRRVRAKAPAKTTTEDSFTVVAHTYQTHLTALRIDALADKKLPKNGPGLAADGSFTLADFVVTAEPLDKQNTNAPVKLKLQAVQARFEEKAMPLTHAVDADANTGWRAKDNPGKDNAAIFALDGDFAGFPGGTELTCELHFKNDGFGRFRLAFSTAPLPAQNETTAATSAAAKKETPAAKSEKPAAKPEKPVAKKGKAAAPGEPAEPSTSAPLDATAQPQHLRELQAMITAKLLDTHRDDAVRWFSHFDDAAKKAFTNVTEHARQIPRAKPTEIYTAAAGGQDVYLLRRGEVDQKLGKSAPGYLQVLSRPTASPTSSLLTPASPSDPRIDLAKWLTDPTQGAGSLVARVIANRIWKHHFGRGLVASPNDFGAKGEAPTHPELLDYLASELIRNGWQLKSLHRLILNSATYQQGSTPNPANLQRDTDNKLLWQRPARRLEAEAIRDALLAVAGRLDPKMFGPSETTADSARRSVYLRVKRSELIPFLTLFDAPEASASIGDRGATTIPTQALTLMNSPLVRDLAARLAKRALTPDPDPAAALTQLFRLALARPPSPLEQQRFTAYYQNQLTLLDPAPKPTPANLEKALAETSLALLCLNEFIYVD